MQKHFESKRLKTAQCPYWIFFTNDFGSFSMKGLDFQIIDFTALRCKLLEGGKVTLHPCIIFHALFLSYRVGKPRQSRPRRKGAKGAPGTRIGATIARRKGPTGRERGPRRGRPQEERGRLNNVRSWSLR